MSKLKAKTVYLSDPTTADKYILLKNLGKLCGRTKENVRNARDLLGIQAFNISSQDGQKLSAAILVSDSPIIIEYFKKRNARSKEIAEAKKIAQQKKLERAEERRKKLGLFDIDVKLSSIFGDGNSSKESELTREDLRVAKIEVEQDVRCEHCYAPKVKNEPCLECELREANGIKIEGKSRIRKKWGSNRIKQNKQIVANDDEVEVNTTSNEHVTPIHTATNHSNNPFTAPTPGNHNHYAELQKVIVDAVVEALTYPFNP